MRVIFSAILLCLVASFEGHSQSAALEDSIEQNPASVVRSMSIQKSAEAGAGDEYIQGLFDQVERKFGVITTEGSDEPCFLGCEGGIVGGIASFDGENYRAFAAHIMLAHLAVDLGLGQRAIPHIEKAETLFLRDLDAINSSSGFRSQMFGWHQSWGCEASPVAPSHAAADLAYVARRAGLSDLADRTEQNWKLRLKQRSTSSSARVLNYLPDFPS
ncbi:hypothetical protein WNY37_04340 [Henriciella sp. AS95]|uniref:hypothetical protein n=1 Tax=Henriciella sp. AS95 TaxID=3135782 RepID=UPI00318109AF